MDSQRSVTEPNAAGSFSDTNDNEQKMHRAQQKEGQNVQDHQRTLQSSQETRKLPQQALAEENTRLHEQLEELQRQLNIMQQQNAEMAAAKTQWKKGKKKRQKQHAAGQAKGSSQTPPQYSPSYGGNGGVGGGGVLLELPSTLRNKTGNNENPRNPLCCVSMSRSQNSMRNGQQKDHQSTSTNDDQDTIEPSLDLEAHQSAPGLHHRNALHPSSCMTTTTAGTTAGSSNDHSLLSNKHLHNKSMDDSLSSDEEDDDDEDSSSPLTSGSCIEIGRTGRDGIVRTRTAANASGRTTDIPNPHDHFQMSFFRSAADRAGWLVGLLVLQSLSSFILARNELLLQQHAVIVQFLTMLVGAGGNAGNQASVGVVRGIAVGAIDRSNVRHVLQREFLMGVTLSVILALSGFIRAAVFKVPMLETFAITSSLFMIVIISVVVGSTLPLGMQMVGIDPAHSSTTIQVIMDITGVVITVHVSSILLDKNFYENLANTLSMDGETR
eukprot:CAMPEP_0113509574 /NCGR_PEP_ID=MMETSP0014_2-20120614/37654_1 /TAXON_ID=2857 /ORGANISM="Nitzschia sp." /LENGTH=494 /DNA_ID=CAMNT_0000405425 /DNA_START=307 /DNA_END=1791 /DNA_ORIENTATION=+ /assembly_acc=CAM_ASM_000159